MPKHHLDDSSEERTQKKLKIASIEDAIPVADSADHDNANNSEDSTMLTLSCLTSPYEKRKLHHLPEEREYKRLKTCSTEDATTPEVKTASEKGRTNEKIDTTKAPSCLASMPGERQSQESPELREQKRLKIGSTENAVTPKVKIAGQKSKNNTTPASAVLVSTYDKRKQQGYYKNNGRKEGMYSLETHDSEPRHEICLDFWDLSRTFHSIEGKQY